MAEIEETQAFETGEAGEPAPKEPDGTENTDPADRTKDEDGAAKDD